MALTDALVQACALQEWRCDGCQSVLLASNARGLFAGVSVSHGATCLKEFLSCLLPFGLGDIHINISNERDMQLRKNFLMKVFLTNGLASSSSAYISSSVFSFG